MGKEFDNFCNAKVATVQIDHSLTNPPPLALHGSLMT